MGKNMKRLERRHQARKHAEKKIRTMSRLERDGLL